MTINHRRVVAAALLREKGEKKKRGDQQEGRSCSVLSKMVAQIDYIGHLSDLSRGKGTSLFWRQPFLFSFFFFLLLSYLFLIFLLFHSFPFFFFPFSCLPQTIE